MSDDKTLPDNVVPLFQGKRKKDKVEEVNLEEQNKAHYQKIQNDIKTRRNTNNRDVTKSHRLTVPSSDKREK